METDPVERERRELLDEMLEISRVIMGSGDAMEGMVMDKMILEEGTSERMVECCEHLQIRINDFMDCLDGLNSLGEKEE